MMEAVKLHERSHQEIPMPRSATEFSRRHKTNEAHIAAQAQKEAKIQQFYQTARDNRIARAARSPQEQLAHLDKTLGKNQGAQRERKRLNEQAKTQVQTKPKK